MSETRKIKRIAVAAVLAAGIAAVLIFSYHSSRGRVRNGENIARIRQKVEDFETARENAKREAEERKWKTVKVWKMVPLAPAAMSKQIEEAAKEKKIDYDALKKKKFPKDMLLASWCLPSDETKLEERGDTLFISSPTEFMLALKTFKPENIKYRFRMECEGKGSISIAYMLRRIGVEKGFYKKNSFLLSGVKRTAELIVPTQDYYDSCRIEMRLAGELTCKELILQEENVEPDEEPSGASQKQ